MDDLISKFFYYFNLNFGLVSLLHSLPGIIVALTIHECAHALAAYLMGDRTAKLQGRMTLNPAAHIDPMGFLCLILTRRFGWAKPVPVNDMNFKNRKMGMLIVSVAGPLSNFITAMLIAIFYALFYNSIGGIIRSILTTAYIINLSIGAFNLIPVPPLDGSNILDAFLTNKQRFYMRRYAIYSNIIMLLLIFSGTIGRILGPVILTMDWLINSVIGLFI
ncbi:MAG TPA: site-2 protease family protein [Bacillota bacterium]|nr:site-2 protease family protein [Bacillota bacterium]